MLKLNKKIITFMIFFVLMLFSISAVGAADDMVNDTSVDYSEDNIDVSIIHGNNVSYENVACIINGSSSNPTFNEVNVTTPSVDLSLKSSDNNPTNSYVDVLVEYGDYYLNVNTKNHLISMNHGFKYNHSNDFNKYVDILAFSNNNRLLLNIDLLNVTFTQSVKMDMFDYIIASLLKVFNSIFNIFY